MVSKPTLRSSGVASLPQGWNRRSRFWTRLHPLRSREATSRWEATTSLLDPREPVYDLRSETPLGSKQYIRTDRSRRHRNRRRRLRSTAMRRK